VTEGASTFLNRGRLFSERERENEYMCVCERAREGILNFKQAPSLFSYKLESIF